MTEQLTGDEKSDGLDIVSIGKLYEGPWEKKYWSSSRGKDRHPYPVGYVALRANSGNTYKMAIFEGIKGPEFTISATDGQSCSGQTPDIAWEGFQKKSSVRLKFWRGKRFSCKIDGAELFGFKNPHVMRLLRGLKANVSPIAEKNLPSFIGNVQSEDTHEHPPDLQANLVKTKTQCKEKRSKKRKDIHVKSVSGGVQHKKGKPQDPSQSGDGQHCRQSCEGNHNKGIPSTSLNLNENNKSDLLSVEDGLQIEKEKCLSVQEANNFINSKDLISIEEGINSLKHQENFDVSNFSHTPGLTSLKIVDEKEDPPVRKDSQMLDNVNLYAPDTLDPTLDSTYILEVEIPIESTCTINDKLNSAQIPVSEKCATESHTKDEMVIASGSDNSERSDSDPVGHEIANSMMTLLLPKALPLLKTFSRKKKKKDEPSAKSSEQMQMEKFSGEVHPPPNFFTENFKYEKQNEKVRSPRPDTSLVVPGLEDSADVAPDSFENDHCEVVECSQDGQVQDAEKTDKNTVGMDLCISEGGHVHPNNKPGDEACHNETTTSKTTSNQDEHCVLEKSFQRDGKIMNSYNLESISPSRKDLSIHSDTPFTEKYPELTDVKIPRHAKVPSHQDGVLSPNYKVTSEVFGASVNYEGQPQASGYTERFEIQGHNEVDDLIPILQSQRISQHDTTKTVDTDEEVKDDSCLNKLTKMVPNNELEDIFELVGCYMHPMPISMVMLRTKGNEVFICVLCGNLMESDRTLFIYKASIEGERRKCPSFIGHTTIISPISRTVSGRQILLDSSTLQFTPDGNGLVLLNSIKAPYCREGSVNCQCSDCTTDCFEKNAVKVVEVKLGYVQLVCKMKTTNDLCSILVCEPSYLVAVEECGKMNSWTMNSSWSAPIDGSYLPTCYCMPNCIVEMKRVPNFPALIVSHSAFGDFCLWDLTRKILVSKFSAPTTSFLPFVPINIFRCPTQPLSTSDASRKKQVEDIMGETQRWSLETDNHVSFPINEENLSLVLLVSSVSNLDLHDECKDSGVSPVGSWSLALLAKGKIVSEHALDSSATIAGASAGYGIVGTCDGSLYIWDIYMGTKLGYLSHCKGTTVSCLAVDDSSSGAFAVAVDDSQLQVYAPRTPNKKHE